MTVEDHLFTRLSGFAGLAALVGSRIYPGGHAGDSPTLPYVTFERISGVRYSAMGSDIGIAEPRYQFSAWSEKHDEAVNIIEQVRACLQRYSGTQNGVEILDCYLGGSDVDLLDEDTRERGRAIDFIIKHRE